MVIDHNIFNEGVVTPARIRARINTAHSEPTLEKPKVGLRDVLVNNNGTLELLPEPSSEFPLKPPPSFIAVIVITCLLIVASLTANVIISRKVKGMDASQAIDMRGVELSNAPRFARA